MKNIFSPWTTSARGSSTVTSGEFLVSSHQVLLMLSMRHNAAPGQLRKCHPGLKLLQNMKSFFFFQLASGKHCGILHPWQPKPGLNQPQSSQHHWGESGTDPETAQGQKARAAPAQGRCEAMFANTQEWEESLGRRRRRWNDNHQRVWSSRAQSESCVKTRKLQNKTNSTETSLLWERWAETDSPLVFNRRL